MPPQDGWPPPQPGTPPPYGPPPGGVPQYSGQQPPGFPQGPWPQQPAAPPPKGNSTKWLLGAIAVLLVIVATIGATLLFTRDGGSDASGPSASGVASDIASADDTGPVSIITEEPTCDAFSAINNSLADIQNQGWGDLRSTLGHTSSWTPDQRSQVDAVATAMHNASDQVVSLAKQTPHRLVREIYGQFIASGREYANNIAQYTPADDGLASVNVSASSALIGICNAIQSGSTGRSLAISPAQPPTKIGPPTNPADASLLVESSTPMCAEWVRREEEFDAETREWQGRDTGMPATQWTPERKALEASAGPLLDAFSSDIAAAGRGAENPVLEDFATAAALYLRAYTSARSSYTDADSWLAYTGFRIAGIVSGACRAVGG
jgi:hypothetical protein